LYAKVRDFYNFAIKVHHSPTHCNTSIIMPTLAPPASALAAETSLVSSVVPPSTATNNGPDTSSESANTSPAKKSKQISKAAKQQLEEYFTLEEWPLNQHLPRGEKYDSKLQVIVNRHGLVKAQLTRQLSNYKKKTYGNSTITLTCDSDEIKERLEIGLGMPSIELVDGILKKLSKRYNDSSFSSEFEKFSLVLDVFPAQLVEVVDLFIGLETESTCCQLLAGLIDYWIDNAAAEFPKTAARIQGSELMFQQNNDKKKGIFIRAWVEEYESFNFDVEAVPEKTFRYFGVYLHNLIHIEWAYSAMECDKPSISIPDESLVGKYSQNTIYYVAGWTLFSLSRALTIGQADRGIYHRFALEHSLEEQEATEQTLPISLVKRRKRRAQVFSTKIYFDFISFVESVYLDNLTLDMMMAYADGDIIHAIKTAILDSEVAREKFMAICNNEDTTERFSDDEAIKLMKYIMERYANMRGSYFVKHLKGTGNGGSAVDKLVRGQATRTKVITAAASSKAAAEARKEGVKRGAHNEEQVWKSVEDSVIEKSSELDMEEENADV